jgi:hypothetical protein
VAKTALRRLLSRVGAGLRLPGQSASFLRLQFACSEHKDHHESNKSRLNTDNEGKMLDKLRSGEIQALVLDRNTVDYIGAAPPPSSAAARGFVWGRSGGKAPPGVGRAPRPTSPAARGRPHLKFSATSPHFIMKWWWATTSTTWDASVAPAALPRPASQPSLLFFRHFLVSAP